MNVAQLLAAYDQQVRGSFPHRIPSTWTATADGPVTRCLNEQGGFVLVDSGLHSSTASEIDALVTRTVEYYRLLGRPFEWKTFSHDNPEIITSLLAQEFAPDQPEALVVGEVAALCGPEQKVPGIVIRQGQIEDLPAVAAMEEQVWSQSWDWFVSEMTARLSQDDPAYLVLAETHDGQVVSAGYLVPMSGTTVACLWGGSTLPDYRGQGIYRAVVRARANEAARRGSTHLQVDASDDSRPILERLGLQVIGTTTPYRWTPSA